ncbi:MAG: hypothetical protein LBI28_05630 [Treponema sp.]|jgi:hypothetical protein|nr:hypothetical protein [Treponema sp.]
MKKNYIRLGFIACICSVFISCVSMVSYRDIGSLDTSNLEVLGVVEIVMKNANLHWWDGSVTNENKQEAYDSLLAKAKIVYQRNDIDIVNISITGQNGVSTRVDLTAIGYVIVVK